MRQATYLNVILTVNAGLLSGLLWTQISGVPTLSETAAAQSVPGPDGTSVSVPNAADQRQKMIEALREIKTSVDATRRVVESGKMKVEVTNLDQLKTDRKP